MFNAPIAFAFAAGLVATVNPCGFAMLPAYLSYFMGIESRSGGDARASVGRALITGSTVSLGFLLVFGFTGTLVTIGVSSIRERIPWVAILIGAAMIGLGVAMLAGFKLTVALPKLEKGTDGRDLRSLFLFGISYAIASLSCALPTFIVVLTGVDGIGAGVVSFFAYAAGMTLVLMALTVSLALARQSLLHGLRRAMQHVDRAAAVLLILAGVYTIYFWILDLRNVAGDSGVRGPVRWVDSLSSSAANWIRSTGGTRVGLLLAIIVSAALLYVLARPTRPAATIAEPPGPRVTAQPTAEPMAAEPLPATDTPPTAAETPPPGARTGVPEPPQDAGTRVGG